MSMRATVKSKVKSRLSGQEARYDALRYATGSVEARLVRQAKVARLQDAGFSAFSQWGQDGIIQYLIANVPIEHEVFVEFGVESYREANTRFLLMHDNWRGLILDGGTEHLEFIETSGLRWRHTIDARSAFITRDNINGLLDDAGLSGDIGLLSVDIDGNDYWVLEVIEAVSPRILIVEYNGVFGTSHDVSVPYAADFDRMAAHNSGLFFGASLRALVGLAERKGYRFVGTTSVGLDAFFVRNDVADALSDLDTDRVAEWRLRQSRNAEGELTYVSGLAEQRELMRGMQVVDLATGNLMDVTDLS